MADTNRDELIAQFVDVTGATSDRAQFYLESANWTLQLALTSFFEGDDAGAPVSLDDDEELPTFASATVEAVPPSSDASSKDKKPTSRSGATNRIMTLGNMASSSDEDDENTGQAFYAGGSDRSGQQVLGPPRKKENDYVSDIFRSARESGAEVVENPHAPSGSAGRSFVGMGYRLGQTDSDHVALPDSQRSRNQDAEPFVLRLWRQGFTINDGELRLYDDKKNKEFLDYVAKGQLPPELRPTDGNMVHVNMEDHRHEDYKPPAPTIKPFTGKGHTLGSPAPAVTDSSIASAIPSAASAANNEENEKSANDELKVDTSAPATSIQIRLADGSRLTGRFNHTHTIEDIRRFIITARPQYAAQSFALLTTFPSKELSNTADTIEAAKLLNAAIMQRLK